MRSLVLLALVALCGCHAHEHALVAAGAHCPDIELASDEMGEDLPAPHVVTGGEAAAGSAMVGLGSLANLFGATAPVTLITPAGTVLTETSGWRQYEGCNALVVCFDGGFCAHVDGSKLIPLVHAVPHLMRTSELEMARQFPGCQHAPIAGRRGPLVWSLHACGQALGCFATKESAYECLGADGEKKVSPAPVSSQ